MYNMTLFFDSNGEMGDHAMGYIAYEGKIRVRPLFTGKILVTQDDSQYAGYNQYMYKFEAILRALQGAHEYIKVNNLINYHKEVTIDLCSQHKPIHNMIYSRTAKPPYLSKIQEILELVEKMGAEGIVTTISNVTGTQNMAKKVVKECLTDKKIGPKQLTLTTTVAKLDKSKQNVYKNNVIEIERFKVM